MEAINLHNYTISLDPTKSEVSHSNPDNNVVWINGQQRLLPRGQSDISISFIEDIGFMEVFKIFSGTIGIVRIKKQVI